VPVSFLTEDQVRRYGRFGEEASSDQLVRYFHLDDADRAFVAEHRGDRNRLGVAVQLGAVRLLGMFLEDPSTAPTSVVSYAAEQLGLDDWGVIVAYANDRGRSRHIPRIRTRYGYRSFTYPGVSFRLSRFLYALCWTGTDRPSVLFDRAVSFLLANKVLLPGLSVLERTVSRVRSRANARLFGRLVDKVTPEQRERLDALVVVPEGARQSPLDRLRDGPYIQSGLEISRALARLDEIRAVTQGLPEIDRLPPGGIMLSPASRPPPRHKRSPDFRTIGGPRRFWRLSARSRPAPATTSSIFSTSSPRRSFPTRRRRRGKPVCARFATSTPRR
tara:strand:+ start:125 stop:1117 length:993 start_codon:yes stop_codon:yes gene_type:complete